MNNIEHLVMLADILITRETGISLNYIQKMILTESLQNSKKTYDQIALEAGYSPSYIKNGVAPKLWQILTKALQQKVSKTNCRFLLEQALQNPTQAILPNLLEPLHPLTLESPEGQVPLASKLYIERSPVEALSYQEITQPRALLRIKAPRKMGKTSLMVRILEAARQQQFQTVKISLNRAGTSIFESTERFLRWLCANTARQLGLEAQLDEYWDEDMGALVSASIYFETYLLQQIQTPIILALDEVNQLFEYPALTRDVLALLRSWHEETRDISVWRKLRFVIVHSTEVYIPINSNQSPFNVGLSIELPPFTFSQVQELALRHELRISDSELQQFMELVNGLPYLVRLGFYHCTQQQMSINQFIKTATRSNSIYMLHLHALADFLQRYPDLANAFDQILSTDQPIVIDQIQAFKLKSMGLINFDRERASVSCGLYQQFFRQYHDIAYA